MQWNELAVQKYGADLTLETGKSNNAEIWEAPFSGIYLRLLLGSNEDEFTRK